MLLLLNVNSAGKTHGCGGCQYVGVSGRDAACRLFDVKLPHELEDGDRIIVARCQQCFDAEALTWSRSSAPDHDIVIVEIKKQTKTK